MRTVKGGVKMVDMMRANVMMMDVMMDVDGERRI